MTFSATDRWGGMERDPGLERLRDLLKSLDIVDREHPDVSVTHETGWVLGAFASGLLVFENVEDEDAKARHMKNVPREEVLRLWIKLAQGDLSAREAEPWLPGYG